MSNAEQVGAPYFEAMFERVDDPWSYRSRWYESRKRALTMACLPARRYANAYEPACAIGELSALLAERCDRLLVSDGIEAAVQAARRRLEGFTHVRVMRAWVPDEWPRDRFDLIVLGEFAYYLDAPSLDALARRTRASLMPTGTVLACHWRRPIEGCAFDGEEVHRRLGASLALPRVCHAGDADLLVDVWCADATSTAQREGLA